MWESIHVPKVFHESEAKKILEELKSSEDPIRYMMEAVCEKAINFVIYHEPKKTTRVINAMKGSQVRVEDDRFVKEGDVVGLRYFLVKEGDGYSMYYMKGVPCGNVEELRKMLAMLGDEVYVEVPGYYEAVKIKLLG